MIEKSYLKVVDNKKNNLDFIENILKLKLGRRRLPKLD